LRGSLRQLERRSGLQILPQARLRAPVAVALDLEPGDLHEIGIDARASSRRRRPGLPPEQALRIEQDAQQMGTNAALSHPTVLRSH
jgi:hypothetical protein